MSRCERPFNKRTVTMKSADAVNTRIADVRTCGVFNRCCHVGFNSLLMRSSSKSVIVLRFVFF